MRQSLFLLVLAGCPTQRSSVPGGTDDDGPVDPGELDCGGGQIANASGQELVIETVDFHGDAVRVFNVTDRDVVLAADSSKSQPAWRIVAHTPPNSRDLPEAVIRARDSVVIHLRASGADDAGNVYLGWDGNDGADLDPRRDEGGSEVALVRPYDAIQDPQTIEAYVRWGGDDEWGGSHTMRDEAALAGRWSSDADGEFVGVLDGDAGIGVLAGRPVNDPAGWAPAPVDCL